MLKAAEYCFLHSLDLETIGVNIDKLNQRLSLVYNEYMLLFCKRLLGKVESFLHGSVIYMFQFCWNSVYFNIILFS